MSDNEKWQIGKKKIVNQKAGNITFFSQNWFINLSECIWIFSDLFLIFEIFFLKAPHYTIRKYDSNIFR